MSTTNRCFFYITGIALGVCSCYFITLNAPFIFDDTFLLEEIQRKTWYQLLLPSAGLRPFYKLSFALNFYISGIEPWSYHVVNILIHIANAWLLFEIVRYSLFLERWQGRFQKSAVNISFVVSVIWAVHPLQTQAVTYLSQRCEIMMTFFYLLSMLLMIRSRDSDKSGCWQIAAVISFLFGLGSKEAMISAPLAIFLYDRFFLYSSVKETLKKHWIYYSGIILILLIPFSYLLVVGKLSHYLAYLTGRHGVDPWNYLLTQIEVTLHFIRLSICPWPLCFDYGWTISTGIKSMIIPLCIWGMLIYFFIRLVKRNLFLTFPLCFFIINLFPRSIATSPHAVVEYRMYLPLAGLIVFYVIGTYLLMKDLFDKKKRYKDLEQVLFLLLPACVIGVFIIMTFSRNGLYNDPLELWKDTAMKAPHNFRAWNYYGIALSEEKDFDKAKMCFEKALRIFPGNMMALNNLANIYTETGDFDRAVPLYYQSLKIQNDRKEIIKKLNSTTHHNLAKIFTAKKTLPIAVYHYREAIRLDPDNPALLYEMGVLFHRAGIINEAKFYFEKTLKNNPDFCFALNDLGLIAVAENDQKTAEKYFRQAVSVNPEYVEAMYNLALLLKGQGRIYEAIDILQQSAKLNPNDQDVIKALYELQVKNTR